MITIGIDPGLTGAIAVICTERGLLDVADIPTCDNGLASGAMKRWVDAGALAAVLRDWSARFDFARDAVHGVIERPIPMPSMPSTTTASTYDSFGVLRALIEPMCRDVAYVAPRVWKSAFGLGTDKDASRACATRLYANAPVKRVKDHNRAEAILIGHWLKREIAG